MTDVLHLAISFEGFASLGTWLNIGIIAGIFTIFALGLQLNVGFTGIFNFGQAGFMAIGAYTMAIFVTDTAPSLGLDPDSFWTLMLGLLAGILLAMVFGLIVGMPSLRLRADYLAIATIAAAEAIRLTTVNAVGLTNGPQGIFGFLTGFDGIEDGIESAVETIGWTDPETTFPLFLVVWVVALALTFVLWRLQKTPWGRVLRAVREDEDAARALGKNAFSYKLQSLVVAAAIGALAGFFLAINLQFINPESFLPQFTFIGFACMILGGLGNYWGVALGAILFQSVFEGMRYLDDVGITETQLSALRYIVLGLVLIGLMAFRPQGIFGKREEMVLGE